MHNILFRLALGYKILYNPIEMRPPNSIGRQILYFIRVLRRSLNFLYRAFTKIYILFLKHNKYIGGLDSSRIE